ncbi:MAG: hypothetical protein Q9167_002915 [Letrouitia subvulpina]
MAYRKPPEQTGRGAGRARPDPGQIQTETAIDRNPRFSFMETPLEVQQPVFQQAPSPTNSVIDESPISPREGHQNIQRLPEHQYIPHFPVEKLPADRVGSPYPLHPPVQLHPAYSAPVADEAATYQVHTSGTTGAPPSKTIDSSKSSTAALSSENHILHQQKQASKNVINTDRDTLIYNPHSLAGPNAAVENHRPGQVSHPNAAVEPEWKHGLCEVDTLCCMGIFCPCMVYSKTQYRISKKTSKEDPTNLLGYESCNGSCGLMAFACGFQCQ